MAARTFGIAIARVSWVWSVHSIPENRRRRRSSARPTCRGLAIPVVSARPIARAPMSTSAPTSHSRRSSGTSPSNGQPNDVEMPQATRAPAPAATCITARSFSSDSATVMLTFARLWRSLAETTVWTSSTPAATARAAPRSFGTSAV